ncbi:homeobox protein BEL1 homolog [Lolium perenne]|uniref:homeobox protein BEL1 homolog n=1 Tax=Lolium perenne TaxID=4522 RepID=UPI0021EAC8B9|nr:homeobox protein BEL1 homolog [Lolium perenne]XP_051183547.1 homeobox protein BEL1 homolog [Lolium perenne]XP_051183548.1 homeobox protein BEL1 homolog [Lolium perenne]XP_051183549.1 homeobox protein BEL1 homolog [Lolium perenne]
MAHDPSLGFADYFSAADAASATLMPAMDHEGPPELYGLQNGMDMLGMHRLHAAAAMPEQQQHGDGAGSTMRFFLEQQQQQQHQQHHQTTQAPLSLSLHHHLGGSSQQQQQHEPLAASWMLQHDQHDVSAHGHGAAWQLRGSRFLLPAQQLLQGFCSLPADVTAKRAKPLLQKQEDGTGGEGSSSSTSCFAPSAQIQAMDALELQRLKDKLYIMLEEVDRRYRRYCEQMRGLAGGFEAVAGQRAAAEYTALAARTISRHFRSLRDGIVAQLQVVRKALGEKDVSTPGMTRGDTPRLKVLDQCIRQQKALHQNGGFMESHPWRPQRGLPERAVTILRAWLFEHFLHPYPSDVDKHILARQTGLSRSQVSNWFINARVRLWKPMVEEMYVEEMKEDDGGGGQAGGLNPNPSSGSSHASDGQQQQRLVADEADRAGGGDRKPTRAQLHDVHDAGSLASIVNIAGPGASRMESFGIMDNHLGFDAYDGSQGQGFGGAGGGVSLTLGLQQHDSHDGGGVNIAFGAPSAQHGAGGFLFPGEQMDAVHSAGAHGHHIQFGVGGMDGAGEASHGGQDQHYRGLSAGFHLLRDLAG